MSEHVRLRFKSRGKGDDQESYQLIEPAVAQQPSDEQLQEEDPPTDNEDITPGQEKEDEGAPLIQGPDLEADVQQLPQAETEDKGEDDSDVKEEIPSTPEPLKMSEGEEGEPQV
ncbi:X antigen family member 5 isoform X2 [Vicugna pacos]|uniref:X antigen family member 5 isoform X2 n=1 Tax=Vicugna pacos TaxID=30538 RepID=A0A6J0B4I0_VICPA|nr:putative G antigen family E member 3 [Vicugna pacos]XP_031527002.1 putative G antigen family E member 3 [Vicugna pacos]